MIEQLFVVIIVAYMVYPRWKFEIDRGPFGEHISIRNISFVSFAFHIRSLDRCNREIDLASRVDVGVVSPFSSTNIAYVSTHELNSDYEVEATIWALGIVPITKKYCISGA